MRYLNSADFKKIIQESINEMFNEAMPAGLGGSKPAELGGSKPAGLGGSKPAGLGGSKPAGLGGSNPTSQQANTATRVDVSKKPKDQWTPKVIYSYYEDDWESKTSGQTNADVDEVLKIGIEYIWNQHQEYLEKLWAQKYSDIFSSRHYRQTGAEKGESNVLEIIVKSGKEEDFKKIVPDLVKDIESLNKIQPKRSVKGGVESYRTDTQNPALKYWLPWFPEFTKILVDCVNKSPNKNDINDINDRMANTWMELLSKLNDSETLDKMRGIKGILLNSMQKTSQKVKAKDASNADTFGVGGFSAGHQLSPNNQIEVFMQDQNATFVTQEWVWRDYFNRTIIDPSKKLIIQKADSRKPSDPEAFERACVRCGYASSQEFKTRKHRGELSKSQIWAVEALYNLINTADTFFHPVIVYDVSNTQVMPGAEDIFNTRPGLINNLRNAAPNAAAIAAGYTPAQTKTPQGASSDMSDEQLNAIEQTLRALIISSGGTIPSSVNGNDVGNDIAILGYEYGAMLLNTGKVAVNFGKTEMEEAFKMCFSACIAATYGFPTAEGANYLSRVLSNRGKDTDAKSMILLFISKYKELVQLININLIKMSRKLKKATVQQQPQQQMSNVVEENSINGNVDGENEIKPVPPLTTDQILSVIGVDKSILSNEPENEYVEQNDTVSNSALQESFFKFLDKMERF